MKDLVGVASRDSTGMLTMAATLLTLAGCTSPNELAPRTVGDEYRSVSASTEGKPIKTPAEFIRAESDRYFYATSQLAGGVNKFNFGRKMLRLDEQTIVRMNRDTLYGGAVIDTKGGATVTFPEIPDGRYASILVLDNDHYAPMVIYTPGVHRLPERTRYVIAAVRIHVRDPNDPAEIKAVNQLQDKFTIQAKSAEPFAMPGWNNASLDELRIQYEREFSKFDRYPDDWQGVPGEVNEQTRHLAAAGAWGLLPNRDALYFNYNGGLPADQCYRATYKVPENNAFWSITVYGNDGYIKSEQAVLGEFKTTLNPDGTFTAHFGSQARCGNVSNRLDISDGWNFLMRVYRPGPSVLGDGYKLPTPTLIPRI